MRSLIRLAWLAIACGIATASYAQTGTLPLPPSYKTTFENADFLVMKVHYGPHEFVPMHDHTAYTTLYVYLNDSGEVQIKHEGPNGFAATRPPTHTGAWRISPGMSERHSVQNLSDTPSDFVRIEMKTIPRSDIKKVFRSEVSSQHGQSVKSEFQDSALQIERITCELSSACSLSDHGQRSLVVAIAPVKIRLKGQQQILGAGDVLWIPPNNAAHLDAGARCLRVSLFF